MQTDPKTFRDHLLSLYQSAAEDVARKALKTQAGGRPGMENAVVRAAARVSALRAGGATTIPFESPAGFDQTAWTCARLGFELLEARIRGNTAAAQQKEGELRYGGCDLGWAETLISYTHYFGPDGTRKAIPYITAAHAGPYVIDIPDDARIALIGDWGTGTEAAAAVLRQVQALGPTILIHLGDIYYSGTRDECARNFRSIVDAVFDRANTRLPVFSMSGNHDMYSGGGGYYDLIVNLNSGDMQQRASFFCLRTKNRRWQLLAMDTGLHDYDPFAAIAGNGAPTWLEQTEEAWHTDRLKELPDGQTILLSHHQLFSAFSPIGPAGADGRHDPCNRNLLRSFANFQKAGRVAAWFWGHEHNLCIYQPYVGLDRGRCVGHGAVPVLPDENPYKDLTVGGNLPALIAGTELTVVGAVYAHGFAMISLDPSGGPARADYFDNTPSSQPRYTELLGATSSPAVASAVQAVTPRAIRPS
jgi:hypothetical protein